MQKIDQNLLSKVLSQPTAPFAEWRIRKLSSDYATASGIPNFVDAIGNLWLNCERHSETANTEILFVAHMDHPGITIDQIDALTAYGRWHGGGPTSLADLPVTIFSESGPLYNGTIVKVENQGELPKSISLKLDLIQPPGNTDLGACLHFQDLSAGVLFDDDSDVVYTKAADDLVSIAALLQLFSTLRPPRARVAALFTRVEEEGLKGSYLEARQQFLNPERVKIIAVDATPIRPGLVRLGRGPAIGKGDHKTLYNKEMVEFLERVAVSCCSDRWQIFNRSEGRTDATAFGDYGYKVAAVEIPVENYHNKGRISDRPFPEVVSLLDLGLTLDLLKGILRSVE